MNYVEDRLKIKSREKSSFSTGWIFVFLIILFIVTVSIFVANTSSETDVIQKVSDTINQTGEIGAMNKTSHTVIFFSTLFGLPLIIVSIGFMLFYNGLVTKEENVLGSWAQVESNLQRRVDLIPNLVSTIKSYMEHEKEVLTKVTASRTDNLSQSVNDLEKVYASHSSVNKPLNDTKDRLGDNAFMGSLASEHLKIGRQINKLVGVVENYPDLQSSDQFMTLQAQLEGTENRINVARMMFNDEVQKYNASIRKIPNSLVASIGDFKRKAYFEADNKAEIATKVSF